MTRMSQALEVRRLVDDILTTNPDARIVAAGSPARAERRVVVTEDVTTFGAAIVLVPDHVGVVYCHHARYPRTMPGLARLHRALITLAADPPDGLGQFPIVWWLPEPAA
jgi:hypothetical protein